jgi:hypothetical protein
MQFVAISHRTIIPVWAYTQSPHGLAMRPHWIGIFLATCEVVGSLGSPTFGSARPFSAHRSRDNHPSRTLARYGLLRPRPLLSARRDFKFCLLMPISALHELR